MYFTSVLISALVSTSAVAASGKSLRTLHTDASEECLAGLEAAELQFGLDIIGIQDFTAAYWSITNEGVADIRMANHDTYRDLYCEAHSASTCSGAINMTLIQGVTGATLYQDNYTPSCRPAACSSDVDYKISLVSRAKSNGPSSLYWYPRGDVISTECASLNSCTLVFNYCGVDISFPYVPAQAMNRETHYGLLKAKVGDDHESEEEVAHDEAHGDHGDHDSTEVMADEAVAAADEEHAHDEHDDSSSGTAIAIGVVGGVAMVGAAIAVVMIKRQKAKAPVPQAAFFNQYE